MKIHIVQKGDTLWKIAKKYGVNFEILKKINSQLSNPNMMLPGMKIKVPTSSGGAKKETSTSTSDTTVNFNSKKEAPIQAGASKENQMPAAPNAAKKEMLMPIAPIAAKKEMPMPVAPIAAKKEMPKPVAPIAAKKEMPMPVAPIAAKKEMPMPVAPIAVKKEKPMPQPIVPEIDINNYYLMNMANMNVPAPQPNKEAPVTIPNEKPMPMPMPQPMPVMEQPCPPIDLCTPFDPCAPIMPTFDYCPPIPQQMPYSTPVYPNQSMQQESSDLQHYYAMESSSHMNMPYGIHQSNAMPKHQSYEMMTQPKMSPQINSMPQMQMPNQSNGMMPQVQMPNQSYGMMPQAQMPNQSNGMMPQMQMPDQSYGMMPQMQMPDQSYGMMPQMQMPNQSYGMMPQMQMPQQPYGMVPHMPMPQQPYGMKPQWNTPNQSYGMMPQPQMAQPMQQANMTPNLQPLIQPGFGMQQPFCPPPQMIQPNQGMPPNMQQGSIIQPQFVQPAYNQLPLGQTAGAKQGYQPNYSESSISGLESSSHYTMHPYSLQQPAYGMHYQHEKENKAEFGRESIEPDTGLPIYFQPYQPVMPEAGQLYQGPSPVPYSINPATLDMPRTQEESDESER